VKPVFFVDPKPIAIISKNQDHDIFIPLDVEDAIKADNKERKYHIEGQDRYFKTRDSNLIDKLNKYLTQTEQEE
jgi:hypothetical protein